MRILDFDNTKLLLGTGGSYAPPKVAASGQKIVYRLQRGGMVAINGTFDGATVKVYFSPNSDGSSAFNDANFTFTAAGMEAINTESVFIWAAVSNIGTNTKVTVDILG